MPVWRPSASRGGWSPPGTLPKTVLISAAVLALLMMLVFFKKDFNIQARGRCSR
jgi:hypothetical protein